MSIMIDLTTGVKQPASVLSLAFRMMRGLTLDFEEVQLRLFDNLDRFLNCHGLSSGWENDMANLVAEIFNDNRELCVKVKPYQVGNHYDVMRHRNFILSFCNVFAIVL